MSPGADTLVTLGRTQQYNAQAREASGTVIPGVSFTWSSSDTAIATVSSTGLVTARASGTASISARAGGVSGSGAMAVVQFVAGVTVTPGTAAATSVGDTSAFSAVARDSSGAVVPGVRFLWTSSNTGVAVVDTLGRAIATGSGVATISATGRGTPGYASLAVTQAATQLVFTGQPTDAVAGAALDPAIEVEVRDARGAVLEDFRGAVTLALEDSASGATLAGTRTVNAVAGVARFSGLWVDRARSGYTLRAVANGLPNAESAAFDITAGSAARLAASVSDSVLETELAGSAALQIEYFDAYGNPTAPVDVELRLSSPSRPDAVLRFSSVLSDSVSRTYTGFRVSRAGSDFRVEVEAGSARAVTDVFASRTSFTAVAAGGSHACAIAPGGTFCWGSNSRGQLGQGVDASALPLDSIPRRVLGDQVLVSIDAFDDRTCGVTSAGAAFCWGPASPFSAAQEDQLAPSLVPNTGTGGIDVRALAVGAAHTCGVTSSGEAYCWGENGVFQLGGGTLAEFSAQPVQVPATGLSGYNTFAIASGEGHSCSTALLTVGDPIVRCWGLGNDGQLGDSSSFTRRDPVEAIDPGNGQFLIGGLTAGRSHSCGKSASRIFCWGLNTSGQIGVSSLSPTIPAPEMLSLSSFSGFGQLDAGGDATCVVLQNVAGGNVRCWGANAYGQLGTGDYASRAAPAVVALPYDASRISVGGTLSCARTTNGIYCWGRNQFGQLGAGTMALVTTAYPVRIVQ